jgi:hypothetical protein
MEWIDFGKARKKWMTFVNLAITLGNSQNVGMFLTASVV